MTTVTKYEILRATFVGYSMPSGMQRVYQDLSLPEYGRQLIDGVYVPVWYNSLQLPTQKKVRIHQETNYENPTGNYFEN